MSDLERRRRRMARAHVLIRVELTLAIAAPVVAGFLFVAAPNFSGGFREPSLWEQLFPWAGIAGVFLGLIWMVRLSRPNPEPGERTWRYRDL